MDARTKLKEKQGQDLPVELRPGEKLLVRGRISGGIYWKTIAFALITVAITLLIAWQLGVLFALVTGVAGLYAFLMSRSLLLVITDQRVFIRSGIIKIDTIQLRYDRIESVEIQRTIPGHILGYATIMITGIGAKLGFIPYLDNAVKIRDVMNDILYAREEKPQHVIVDKVESTPPA